METNKDKPMKTDFLSIIEKPNSEKTITTVSIFFGGLFLFQLYKEFGMLRFMFTNSYAEWDFGMAMYFLPLIVIPAATILFFLRKKTGWLLLTIFLVYSAISAIGQFILTINRTPSGVEALDRLFPQISTVSYILGFLLMSGIMWVISRENIRTVYSISKQTMIVIVVVTALIVGLGMMAI